MYRRNVYRFSKSGFFFAASQFYFLKLCTQKWQKKSLKLLIKWVKMNTNLRKFKKSWIFQLAHTNLKILRKFSKILRRRTTVRRWHLETLNIHFVQTTFVEYMHITHVEWTRLKIDMSSPVWCPRTANQSIWPHHVVTRPHTVCHLTQWTSVQCSAVQCCVVKWRTMKYSKV